MADVKRDILGWLKENDGVAVLLAVLVGHLSLFPKVADLDAFYHVGHAAAYLERGLFDTSLPWATHSIISEHGADLWWGLHVLLMPLAAVWDLPTAVIRIAAMLLTAGLGYTVYWVLRRHGVAWPGLWAAVFLIAVPNVFFRYLMVRPHMISLAASIAMVSVLVRGRAWQVGALAALISWTHLSLFWVAPGLVLAYTLIRLPVVIGSDDEPDDQAVELGAAWVAVFAGLLVGWLARPHPIATAQLLNVQLLQLFTQKALDQPLTFAAEISPIGVRELLETTWLFLIAWLGLVVVAARAVVHGIVAKMGRERATLLVVCVGVSVAFLGLALLSARRGMVQWTAFGTIAIALGMTHLSTPEWCARWLRPIGVVAVVYLGWGVWRHTENVRLVASDGFALREVSEFLEASSEDGDLVFHARWDNFGPLFAWNRTNHYIGGMDPIFQYAFDPEAYWEHFYLSADLTTEWTCNAFPCQTGIATDTHTVLTEHFGARWVLVQPSRNPLFTLELLNNPLYELALETQREAVFEILPSVPDGGADAPAPDAPAAAELGGAER